MSHEFVKTVRQSEATYMSQDLICKDQIRGAVDRLLINNNKLPRTVINSYYRCCRVSAEWLRVWHLSMDTWTMASHHRVIMAAWPGPIKHTKLAITVSRPTFITVHSLIPAWLTEILYPSVSKVLSRRAARSWQHTKEGNLKSNNKKAGKEAPSASKIA